jgi:UDP-N-acetylmuramate dehydrogenase
VVRVAAGCDWDTLVAAATDQGWCGLEAMSGIPGTVGAAPVQNIGAYGQEFAHVVASVRPGDRARSQVRTLGAADLDFGYRSSLLKRSMRAPSAPPAASGPSTPRAASGPSTPPAASGPWYPTPRFVVLDVTVQVRLATLSEPIAYAELACTLGVAPGTRVPSVAVREAVLALRAAKGMLLDGRFGAPPGDHDRWSAGSFFTNPILDVDQAAALPPHAPRYPVAGTSGSNGTSRSNGTSGSNGSNGTHGTTTSAVKTSAAWLIEHAGFAKGFGLHGPHSPATVSTRHTLALTNRGAATARDIVDLARAIRDGVQQQFGIRLEPEPVLVGLSLDG